MKHANLLIALWSLLAAACDGLSGPPPQFSEKSKSAAAKEAWQCGSFDGSATPKPLDFYVSGKAVGDNEVITVDVHALPFGQPVYVYGLLQHPGPDDAAAWSVRPPILAKPAKCEIADGTIWSSFSSDMDLHSPAQQSCPLNHGAYALDDSLKFRIVRPFDGPLQYSPVQFSVHATGYSWSGDSSWVEFGRQLTVQFTDVPSTAQFWPKGPLVLVPRADNNCADAFVHAINLGQGHAPVAGLHVQNGLDNLVLRTPIGPPPLYMGSANDPMLVGHFGDLTLPTGWQIDAHTDQIWHVEYCAKAGDPPLTTSLSVLGAPANSWTFDTSMTTKRTGCLRIAQGDPLDLSAKPWTELASGGGLKVDLFNVCDTDVPAGNFQGFGSPHIHFSAAPFGEGLAGTNYGDIVKVWPHRSVPLYVAYEFNEAGLPAEISATLVTGNGAQFHFTAHQP